MAPTVLSIWSSHTGPQCARTVSYAQFSWNSNKSPKIPPSVSHIFLFLITSKRDGVSRGQRVTLQWCNRDFHKSGDMMMCHNKSSILSAYSHHFCSLLFLVTDSWRLFSDTPDLTVLTTSMHENSRWLSVKDRGCMSLQVVLIAVGRLGRISITLEKHTAYIYMS